MWLIQPRINKEMASSGDSVMHSLHKEPRRRFTHKEKGKKKMSKCATDRDESDWNEFDSGKNEDRPSETKSKLAKRALKLANEKLR